MDYRFQEGGAKSGTYLAEATGTISWSGECKNGPAHERGVLQRYLGGKLGNKFEGEYEYGKQNARVLFAFGNGDLYDGEWKDGKPNVIGIYVGGDETYSG